MTRFRVSPAAWADMAAIHAYIDRQNPKAAGIKVLRVIHASRDLGQEY